MQRLSREGSWQNISRHLLMLRAASLFHHQVCVPMTVAAQVVIIPVSESCTIPTPNPSA